MIKNGFRRLGIFIENKHRLVIALSLLLILPAVYGATKIEMANGTDTFISPDSRVAQDFARYSEHFSGSAVILMVEGQEIGQLLQAENIQALEAVENQAGGISGVKSVIGPNFFIKQAVAQSGGAPELPQDSEALKAIVTDSGTGDIRQQFAHVFPDNRHALVIVILEGGLMDDAARANALVVETQQMVDGAGFTGVKTILTGEPVMNKAMDEIMGKSLGYMMIMAVALMLAILALVFKVRNFFAWRWLPMGIVVIAIIYAFGFMGLMSVPMTMVTMAAFPVLIGLGVDYAIQFHNRYDEEARRGETVAEAVIDSITHIGPTIGIAIITACLGFAALFFSPIPMIVDFGYTLIIGVVFCYLLAVSFLMALLYWHDRRQENGKESASGAPGGGEAFAAAAGDPGTASGIVERALHRLAPGIINSFAVIIPISLVLCCLGIFLDGRIGTETDTTKFISGDLQVFKDLKALEEVAGGQSSANILIEAADVTSPEVLGWMADFGRRVTAEQSDLVDGVSSLADMVAGPSGGRIPQSPEAIGQILAAMPASMKNNLVTGDHTAANITVNVGNLDSDQIEELSRKLTGYLAEAPAGVETAVTGGIIVQNEVISGLTEGREAMTLIGVAFVFAGILVLFRFRVARALLAILPIGLIIGWSAIAMYLLGIVYTPITATLGALIIGIGVEFTILLMMRYYEERDKGEEPQEAMTTAMTKIGRAVIASGLTVIAGFGSLLIARDFPLLQDFGIVTMINVLFALVSTLIVLPPLIVKADSWNRVPVEAQLPAEE